MEEIGRRYRIPQEDGCVDKLVDKLREKRWIVDKAPPFVLEQGGLMYNICRHDPSPYEKVYLGFIYQSEVRTLKPKDEGDKINQNELRLFLSRLDL